MTITMLLANTILVHLLCKKLLGEMELFVCFFLHFYLLNKFTFCKLMRLIY